MNLDLISGLLFFFLQMGMGNRSKISTLRNEIILLSLKGQRLNNTQEKMSTTEICKHSKLTLSVRSGQTIGCLIPAKVFCRPLFRQVVVFDSTLVICILLNTLRLGVIGHRQLCASQVLLILGV